MRVGTLAIVGVGLIGGSIGLAARRRRVAERVVGVDRDPGVLRRAVDLGILDEGCPSLQAAAVIADVMIFCTPVDTIATQVQAAAAVCRPGTLLTDVGS